MFSLKDKSRVLFLAAVALALAGPVAAQNAIRLKTAPEGNEARYRVREQLLNIDFPSDAIGKTSKVEGEISVDGKGAIIDGSKFTIDLASLTSDKQMRDNFIKRRTL